MTGDLDKAKVASTASSISTYAAGEPLPDSAYTEWAALHKSEDGPGFDKLVGTYASQRGCFRENIAFELLTNINRLEMSIRYGAYMAFRNATVSGNKDEFRDIPTVAWLRNFPADVRGRVKEMFDTVDSDC
ncbi:hypothetical protein DBA20_19595 [Pandoraea capi]|nr:hypothetical protein [Pandoraea sp. LA3]MDN4585183.1 hypothetical protein [Pandoraea capi]